MILCLLDPFLIIFPYWSLLFLGLATRETCWTLLSDWLPERVRGRGYLVLLFAVGWWGWVHCWFVRVVLISFCEYFYRPRRSCSFLCFGSSWSLLLWFLRFGLRGLSKVVPCWVCCWVSDWSLMVEFFLTWTSMCWLFRGDFTCLLLESDFWVLTSSWWGSSLNKWSLGGLLLVVFGVLERSNFIGLAHFHNLFNLEAHNSFFFRLLTNTGWN